MKTAVFFERDGVLNRVRVLTRQQIVPVTLEDFHVNEEAVEPLAQLKAAGYLLLAVTNQPGISLGSLARREMDLMHGLLRHRLPLDDILVCPHDEADRCSCRKPRTGLLVEAAFKWHLDLDRCFVVSDKWQDAAAAQMAGCTSVLIQSPWNGSGHHDFIVPSLAYAASKILQFQAPDHAYAAQRRVA